MGLGHRGKRTWYEVPINGSTTMATTGEPIETRSRQGSIMQHHAARRQRQCGCRRLHGSYDDPRHFCKSTLSVCSIATMRPLQATRLPPYSSLSLERPPALHARTPLKWQCEHAQREGPILLCQSKLGWSGLSNRRSPEPCHRCACGGPPRGP